MSIPFEEKRKKDSPLPYSCKYVMDYLVGKGLLQLLEPRPHLSPLPPKYNVTEHCPFHQTPGHSIDRCFTLKH